MKYQNLIKRALVVGLLATISFAAQAGNKVKLHVSVKAVTSKDKIYECETRMDIWELKNGEYQLKGQGNNYMVYERERDFDKRAFYSILSYQEMLEGDVAYIKGRCWGKEGHSITLGLNDLVDNAPLATILPFNNKFKKFSNIGTYTSAYVFKIQLVMKDGKLEIYSFPVPQE